MPVGVLDWWALIRYFLHTNSGRIDESHKTFMSTDLTLGKKSSEEGKLFLLCIAQIRALYVPLSFHGRWMKQGIHLLQQQHLICVVLGDILIHNLIQYSNQSPLMLNYHILGKWSGRAAIYSDSFTTVFNFSLMRYFD